jgi:hypothetical protein
MLRWDVCISCICRWLNTENLLSVNLLIFWECELSVSDLSGWWLCRYLAEFKSGTERKEAAESTMNAYKAAQVGILMQGNLFMHMLRERADLVIQWWCLVVFVGYCSCRSGSDPPHQAWSRSQLLCVLLWDPELPWPRLQPCETGLLWFLSPCCFVYFAAIPCLIQDFNVLPLLGNQ